MPLNSGNSSVFLVTCAKEPEIDKSKRSSAIVDLMKLCV